VLPVAFVSALVGIKAAVQNSDSFLADTVPALLPNSLVTFTPLSFADYLTAIKAARVCRQTKQSDPNAFPFEITGIDNNGFNWQVPFVKCNSYQCEYEGQDASPFCEYGAIGLAPTTSNDEGGQQRAEKFADWLDQTYAVSELRQPLIQFHSSPEAMDEYVTAPTYGTSDSPKIIMGIVFEGNDPSAYHYTLRPNATNFNAPEEANRPATWTMADTSKMFDDFARNDFEVCVSIDGTPRLGPDPFQRSCTIKYAYNGVLTMQRLVHDFILNQTTDTFVDNAGVRFVQFPTESYEQTGFYRTIQGALLGNLFGTHPHHPRFRDGSTVGYTGLTLLCGHHYSIHLPRKRAATKGAHENDECGGVGHPVVLVLHVLSFQLSPNSSRDTCIYGVI